MKMLILLTVVLHFTFSEATLASDSQKDICTDVITAKATLDDYWEIEYAKLIEAIRQNKPEVDTFEEQNFLFEAALGHLATGLSKLSGLLERSATYSSSVTEARRLISDYKGLDQSFANKAFRLGIERLHNEVQDLFNLSNCLPEKASFPIDEQNREYNNFERTTTSI